MYTLEQLSKGEVTCINDGTLEQIEAVLKHCFPNDDDLNGKSLKEYCKKYHSFCKNKLRIDCWTHVSSDYELALPTQSVKEFYKQLQPQKTMEKQYLTRKQLIELYKADSCPDWKAIIGCYLNLLVLESDDFKVEIKQHDIDLANQKCKFSQRLLLTKAGLVLNQEIAVCDSKDGDCIKVSSTEYWINRDSYCILIRFNFAMEISQIKHCCLAKEISPDIKGTLVKEPLSFNIKIN
jgi:hypothetical protein